ncbi:hypothetical protein [Candidatus Viadribacter manganicus]|uniref:Uncharacterized protein n=1 Tax=Candidatus Viadribacter manganicus TaxID=1759059 RepID=A0A1B1AFX4_9PROT|nr:hypothetical protein [Candidatus Viadribacter manganicus]ANP45460.1 hypothetical protein ATE48_05780 [Candidatus Viadribacter manganicus]
MSHKLKLAVVLAVAALTMPSIASAQDPSTRTDLTIIGAVSTESIEQIADTHATAAPEAPVVYEDAAPSNAQTSDNVEQSVVAAADLSDAVEPQ